MAKWYCKIKGKELGPYTDAELRLMAKKGKLRPRDPVRSDVAMDWIKASAMDGLFTEDEILDDQDAAEEQRLRKDRRRQAAAEAGQGYYACLWNELAYGGEWLGAIIKAALINAILFGLTTLWISSRVNVQSGSAVMAVALSVGISAVLMFLGVLLESLLLGLPLLAVTKDWRTAHILDAYAFTQFYGCLASFFTAAILLSNPRFGVIFLLFILPLFQSGAFAYLACTRWNMPFWLTGLLGGARLVLWVPLFLAAVFSMAALLGATIVQH